jgi:hypothetical protein
MGDLASSVGVNPSLTLGAAATDRAVLMGDLASSVGVLMGDLASSVGVLMGDLVGSVGANPSPAVATGRAPSDGGLAGSFTP